jgi:hypothetical protein
VCIHPIHQGLLGGEFKDGICASVPSPLPGTSSRPNSMVVKVIKQLVIVYKQKVCLNFRPEIIVFVINIYI